LLLLTRFFEKRAKFTP